MMRAVVGWIVAGVLGAVVVKLARQLSEQVSVTLALLRSNYEFAETILEAKELGTLDEVEGELRELVRRLGDELAMVEEHIV